MVKGFDWVQIAKGTGIGCPCMLLSECTFVGIHEAAGTTTSDEFEKDAS
jgi:hypothetical protein